MKKLIAAAILLCHFGLVSCSQAPKEASAETATSANETTNDFLKVNLELTDTNYQNKNKSRSVLTLMNTGTQELPASGWKLYFNGFGFEPVDAKVATVKHFNGDLFYLTPGPNFKKLSPNASTKIEVTGRRVRNLTDFPSGFYLVFDNKPAEGLPVAVETTAGNLFEKSDQKLAGRVYEQNARIKDMPLEKLTKVFPTPVSYHETTTPFTLNSEVTIITDEAFNREAGLLANDLTPALGKKLSIQNQGSGKAIILKKAAEIAPEGYELSVNADRIQISGSSGAGIFYGIQSLKTMLPATAFSGTAAPLQVPGVEVKDAPRFGYRGFLMDVARNFQPKSEVLKVLDVMALYKLNVFHFHFSEDEGWRLEIPALPELTQVGATRAHAVNNETSLTPSYGSGPLAQNAAGTGFYSTADFIDILKYARDRHITVIPEIESPGHARAAIKSMDARYKRLMKEGKKAEAEQFLLRDLQDKSVYESVQGWNDNVMDVSQPSTYRFLETVVDALQKMYREADAPLETIHFGGDEVPAGVWQKSPAVKNLMARNPAIKTTDDLWYYYFDNINQMLKKRNLYLSGWEEIGLKKVVKNGKVDWVPNERFSAQNFHVNVWKNSPGSGAEDLAYRMANAGYKVILTGVTHLYLDLAYNTSSQEPGQYWGGYVDIDKPFYFIPYDYLKNLQEDDQGNPINRAMIKSKEPLTAKGKANIVGMEAPLWSETNRSPEQFEYKMLPKLLGVAERAWAKDPAWATEKNPTTSQTLYNQAWSEFINVAGKKELPRLDHYAGGFKYRVPPAGAKITNGQVVANVQFPGLIIRYTTDGSEPTNQSPVYKEPIANAKTVKFKVFTPAGRSSTTTTITN